MVFQSVHGIQNNDIHSHKNNPFPIFLFYVSCFQLVIPITYPLQLSTHLCQKHLGINPLQYQLYQSPSSCLLSHSFYHLNTYTSNAIHAPKNISRYTSGRSYMSNMNMVQPMKPSRNEAKTKSINRNNMLITFAIPKTCSDTR